MQIGKQQRQRGYKYPQKCEGFRHQGKKGMDICATI